MEKRKKGAKNKMSLCDIFLCKENLKRDIAITAISVVFAALWIITSLPSPTGKNPRVLSESVVENTSKQEIKKEIQKIENENKSENICVGEASNPFEVIIETKKETEESKPVIYKPKITAPKPAAETKRDALGRMICAKKNDKPSKSKKHKGRNMDMECCLDPDEYPNPWCYYPPEKYGKLLDKLK
jgi:type IV secretory pathway VirB10-like protein